MSQALKEYFMKQRQRMPHNYDYVPGNPDDNWEGYLASLEPHERAEIEEADALKGAIANPADF